MMFKKSLLSIAVASSMILTGCLDSGGQTSQNAYPDYNIDDPRSEAREGRVWPAFDPINGDLPIPNDLIFDQVAKDGSFQVSSPDSNPVIDALNQLSGASTVAPIDIKLSGRIDPNSVDGRPFIVVDQGGQPTPMPNPAQNVFLIELDYASGDPVQGLSAGEPPTIPVAVAFANAAAAKAKAERTKDPADVTAANVRALELAAAINNSPAYEVSIIQMDGTDYLRINPTKPLNPRKRYVVAITNGIKDASGQPLIASDFYDNLTKTDAEQAVGAEALKSVRRLINGLWEPIAENYFQLTNAGRAPSQQLSAKNVVLSYSFTTSGDEKVMEYIANPAEWFNDQITGFLRLSAVKSVIANQSDLNGDGKVDYNDTSMAAAAAVNGFPTAELQQALGALFAAAPPQGCQGLTGPTAIGCVATSLSAAPSAMGGFADLLPKPKARTVTTTSHSRPVNFVSAVTSSFILPQNAATPPLVAQGTIDVPYYLGIPRGNDGSPIQTQSWQADDTLARAINQAFGPLGLSLPQANPDVSKVVNYIFPFPKQSDADLASEKKDLTIPWLAIYPHPASGHVKPYKTVIYQHGITTDRSAALSVGTILAQQGFAVIAIDQVAHGVVPATQEAKLDLAGTLLAAGKAQGLPVEPTDANKQKVVDGLMTLDFVMSRGFPGANTLEGAQALIATVMGGGTSTNADLDQGIRTLMAFENTVANAGSMIPGIARTEHERHFDFTAAADGLTPVKMNPEQGVGASGSLFINLTGFTNSRDKLRQGVVDLLNLRQSLASIDLDGNANSQDLSGTDVYFAGHSLGTLSGIPFFTVANAAGMEIKAAAFLTPASGVVRMLENSPSFAPRIIGGLAASGVTMGTANYETFLRVMQATIDSVDPINFADNLSGKAQGDFQTNVTNAGALILEVAGTTDENGNTLFPSDQTTVTETETVQLTTQFGTPFPDYLSGSEQLARVLGTTSVGKVGAPDDKKDLLLSRLGYGSHGMFVMPVVTASERDGLSADEIAAEEQRRQGAFQEGVTQMATFFTVGGQLPAPVGTNGLTGALGVIVDDAAYDARKHKQLNP